MEEERTRFLEYQVVTFQKLISNATPGTKKTFKQIISQRAIWNLMEGL